MRKWWKSKRVQVDGEGGGERQKGSCTKWAKELGDDGKWHRYACWGMPDGKGVCRNVANHE